MNPAISVQVKGLAEVRGQLRGVQNALRNRIMRKAVSDATAPLLKAMKATAPVDSGQLRKSLGRKVKVYRNSGVVVGIVGPRSGFKAMVRVGGGVVGRRRRGGYMTGRWPTMYAHLAERKTGFASRAAASAQAAAEAALQDRLTREVANL